VTAAGSGKRSSRGGTHNLLQYIDLGFRFAASLLFFGFVGYLLDIWLTTLPLFLIFGFLLGGASGFYALYRAVYPLDEHKK